MTWWIVVSFVFAALAAPPSSNFEGVRQRLLSGKSVRSSLDRALSAEDQSVRDAMLAETPEERRARLAPLARSTSVVVSWHLTHARDDPAAAKLALRTLLRRKGLLVDTEYATRDAVRRSASPETRQLLTDLLAALEQLEQTRSRGASERSAAAKVKTLQRDLATRSRPFRAVAGPARVTEVAQTLDRTSQLVEFVVYRPWDAATDTFGEERYALYTLDRNRMARGIDLGPVEVIDDAVRRFRGAIIGQATSVAPLADDLRARLFGDAPWVTRARTVFIAPDGLLHHVPFDLVLANVQDDRFLGGPRVVMLASGRERTQIGAWSAETSAPLAVFDVDYGPGRPWLRLPGTKIEGDALEQHVPELVVLEGPQATESAVFAVERPRLLHIATHGFFEAQVDLDTIAPFPDDTRGLQPLPTPSGPASAPAEAVATGVTAHPALRSGIVFANANLGGNVATAAEWSNRDLRGTRLVVLSACETGLGEIRNGDGILGLRRALMLAGSEAQVLSLWKVDDEATGRLMAAMYARLAEGATAMDALTHAKREVANDPKLAHPFFWAAFTISGDARVRLR